MKKVRKLMLCAMLPLCFAATAANAQGIGLSGSYVKPPNWESMMDKLTPEQRAKVIDIEQQMLRMQVDHDDSIAKTEGQYQHAMMQLQDRLFDLFKGH
jgi:TolA-binding protein